MCPELINALVEASGLTTELVESALVPAKQLSHGDFSFPCFVIAKALQTDPVKAAKDLGTKIKLPVNIEKFQVVGPYVNFFRAREPFLKQVLTPSKAEKTAEVIERRHKTVIVEYSSVNIAKPFHIGHLRTTLIGHSLDRIFRALGYKVISINHLGDWGTQFGFVFAGCHLWGRPKQASIFDLVELYVRASNLRKQQDAGEVPSEHKDTANVNTLAREYFLRLEAGDAEALEFWQWCLDISLVYLKSLYARLGVHFDYYTGESFYRDKLQSVEEQLRQSGVLTESKGALGVDLGKPLGFVRVFSEDGRSLYITRDLATAEYRVKTWNPEKILYVVGAPQTHYFQQLKAILAKIKHPAAESMTHVAYGNVPGISTRASKGSEDRIWIDALLNDAKERALDAYRNQVEKRPAEVDVESVAEAVGKGAIFFNYLSRSNIKEFNFSWEEALNFQGDTGPYVQYAVARLNSIAARATEEGILLDGEVDASLLVDDDAYKIASVISRFEQELERAARDFEPQHVANFVLELARAVSESYSKLRVLGQEANIAKARLALFNRAREILTQGLELLGVPVVARM